MLVFTVGKTVADCFKFRSWVGHVGAVVRPASKRSGDPRPVANVGASVRPRDSSGTAVSISKCRVGPLTWGEV